jgi:transposase
MIYAGIDISKHKHDCFITNDFGDVLKDVFTFKNNAAGFRELQSQLESVKNGEEEIRIGFEATGNYAVNLKLFLEKTGYEYMEINALLVKEYIKSKSLRRTTTDSLSAIAIAGYISDNKYRPHPTAFYPKFALKQLTRFRSSLMKNRTRYMIQLTNVLDCIFPEFKPLFDGKFTVTSLYILEHYQSPEAIANMNSRSYEILRKKSRGHFTLDMFVQLKALAKNTVGVFDECYRIELVDLLELYHQIDAKIQELDDKITEIIKEINPPTLSIKGVGEVSAAIIISEVGDFSRFSNPHKLLAFAGLEPGHFQSGTTEYEGHMVKRGSAHLRAALMNCARSIALHNEIFAAYFRKKLDEGKEYNVAANHTAKKLVRLIFALETKGEMFNPEKLR